MFERGDGIHVYQVIHSIFFFFEIKSLIEHQACLFSKTGLLIVLRVLPVFGSIRIVSRCQWSDILHNFCIQTQDFMIAGHSLC